MNLYEFFALFCLLYVLLCTGLYFLAKRLSKKVYAEHSKQQIATWLVTIFGFPTLAAFIIIVYVMVIIIIGYFQLNRNFSSQEWKNSKDTRYTMANNLLEDGLLLNKDRKQIVGLLGLPYSDTTSLVWSYSMGASNRHAFGETLHYLEIKFDNNKVKNVHTEQNVVTW